jgi:predicted metal-binding protein
VKDEGRMAVKLLVCTTCRAGEPVPDDGAVPGARLADALEISGPPEGVVIARVECLSACSQGCAVALSAPGRWSYVYGRLTEADAPEILAGAAHYAASVDGIVPWRERPVIFRKQSLARIPPIGEPV